MNILEELTKPLFILAPLYDVTDTVFRQLIADCAKPDVFFTEFVNVDGLQSKGREQVIKALQFTQKETPLIAQIWGKNPDNYFKTAQELVNMGFAGVDINMGCPDKTIVKQGCCCALINDRPLAQEILSATKKGLAGKLPISVKTRTGFNEVDYSWHEFLLKQDLDMLTIHGRTKSQMSKVPADWEAINTIRELRDKISPKTLLIGNGDVMTRQQGRELAIKYKLDGIMIGRGVFNDPYVFSEHSPWEEMAQIDRIELFKKHLILFSRTWGDSKPLNILNKFCKIYINNFDGAKDLREQLMSSKSVEQSLKILKDFTTK
jgi:tRNA-dihydrouridine synthase